MVGVCISPSRAARRAFTLVELLVVIGIIALLVSILLPALQSARRSAESVKCASSLKEIGNAIVMYANENRGYVMPAKLSGAPYNLYGVTYNASGNFTTAAGQVTSTTLPCYWTNFLTKYVARTQQMGNAVANTAQANAMKATVLWGCPAFPTYGTPGSPGVNVTQNGYGPNHLPSFTPTFPALFTRVNIQAALAYPEPPGLETLLVYTTATTPPSIFSGNWVKLGQFKQPSERCMIADSQFWIVEADTAPASGIIPGQKTYDPINTYTTNGPVGQTLFDFYRHGRSPKVVQNGLGGLFDPNGGKVSFNILYADGHVRTSNDRRDAFLSTRMRFPG